MDLLSFNDIDFVCCAYVTILGRQPDGPGQAHFLRELRAGVSKLDVLWRLRRAPEAKQHDPGIAGLDRVLKRAKLQRRPLLGAISRFLRCDADGSSQSDRSMRVLMNATFVNQRYLQTIAERVTAGPELYGLQSSPSTEATPALVQVDQNLTSDSLGFEQPINTEMTPELDHLRSKKAKIGRSIGVLTP
jgi:hypothetical protein